MKKNTGTRLAIALIILTSCKTYLTDPKIIKEEFIEAGGGNPYVTSHLEFDINGGHFTIKGNVARAADSTSAITPLAYQHLLPFRLTGFITEEKYLGDTMIENKIFYKIEMVHSSKDLNDSTQCVVQYWINRDDFSLGFVSYSQIENTKTAIHFLKAVNPRKINNIRFYDYVDHQPKDSSVQMGDLELVFTKGELQELGVIELKNIIVH